MFLSFLEEVIALILLLAVNKLEKKAQYKYFYCMSHTHSCRIAVLKLDEKVQELMRERMRDRAEGRYSEDIHIQEQVRQTELVLVICQTFMIN